MAEGLDILGLNLPFYIMIILFFSYLIWSKFMNEKRLSFENNIDNIFDLTTIFFFMFITLMGFFIIFPLLGEIFGLLLVNIENIVKIAQKFIIYLVSFGIISFIYTYRREDSLNERDFETFFLEVLKFYSALITFLIALLILSLATSLKFIIGTSVIVLIFIFLFFYFIIVKAVNRILFQLNLWERLATCRVILFNILFLIVLLSFGFLTIPIVSEQEPINLNYVVYEASKPHSSTAYLKIRVPYEITNFGKIYSFISHIPVPYKNHNFDLGGVAGNNFKLLINQSNEYNLQTFISSFENIKTFNQNKKDPFGFTKIILYNDQEIMALKFDRSKIIDQGINALLVEGYVKKNISELSYKYLDNRRSPNICNEGGCSLIFNITNGLNLPVRQEGETILNLNNRGDVINKINCKFDNLTVSPMKDTWRLSPGSCEGDSCQVIIDDKISRDKIFNMFLRLDDTVLRLIFIDVQRHVDVDVMMDLVC